MRQHISLTFVSLSVSPLLSLFAPDAYCSVSGTLHPQVLYFHSQCLSLCGDIQLMLAQNANNRAAYLEEYSYQTKEDQEILHSLHRESSCQGQSLRRDNHTNLKSTQCLAFLLDVLELGVSVTAGLCPFQFQNIIHKITFQCFLYPKMLFCS